MPLLLKYWKYILVLVLCIACYAAGRLGSGGSTVDKTTDKTTDKVAEVSTEQTHEVEQTNKVTTITKKPDGTVVTVIADHSKIVETQKQNQSTSETKVEAKTETKITPAPTDPYRPDYRLGVQMHNDVGLTWQPSYSVEAGYRVLGNLWGTASYDIQKHGAGLGLSVDF